MAQRVVTIAEIGEVILSKRKGASNMRLSINGAGKVRVGMPYWTPYGAGIAFAKSKRDWIQKQLITHTNHSLKEGDLIGKAHRLHFLFSGADIKISTRITATEVIVTSAMSPSHPEVQKKAESASERALKQEAEKLLPQRQIKTGLAKDTLFPIYMMLPLLNFNIKCLR